MATNNSAVIKAAIAGFTKTTVKPYLTRLLCDVADKVIAYIEDSFEPVSTPPARGDGNVKFPVHTGNMRDATGVGIYCDGVLFGYKPTRAAIRKQNGSYGYQLLENALNAGRTAYGSGVWFVLFSAHTYAFDINEKGSKLGRGVGFFDDFKDEVYNDIIAVVRSADTSIPIGFKM